MADTSYSDFLLQEAERQQQNAFRGALLRTVIGYSLSLICLVTFTLAGVELNKHGYLYSVASGLAAIYVFAGLTPRIFKHVKTIGHLYPQTAQGAGEQAQAIRKGLQNGTLQSAKLHDLSRRTKALFLLRLLGIVLILLGVVALRLLAPSPTQAIAAAARPQDGWKEGTCTTPLDKTYPFVRYSVMTTRLALIIMACIIGFFVLDHYVLGLEAGVFLAKKGIDLINYLAIWR